jgi:hypothetical protein
MLVCLPAVAASAQVPNGGEFRVNTYTTGSQEPFWPERAVSAAPNGDFVTVWMSDTQDGSLAGVFGQRYRGEGGPMGAEFQVNTYTTSRQNSPAVAVGATGAFVVAWQSQNQDGSGYGIFAQRYDRSGTRAGAEFRVNTTTAGEQTRPAVAVDVAGSFIVAWGGGAPGFDVFGQRFDAAGNPQGGEFQVNSYTTSTQAKPAVDVDGAGNAVIVWESFAGGPPRVFGQRFSAAGVPMGAEFAVNTTGSGYNARVAAAPGGGFVVAWGLGYGTGDSQGIFARRFDASGAPLGPEFLVNSYTTGTQYKPDVDMDASGRFVVTWGDEVGANGRIFAKRYDEAGVPRGAEFQVSTSALAIYPSLASDAVGNFAVTWVGDDGFLLGVKGQRYGGLVPEALAVDAAVTPTSNGNGVFEAGETLDVNTSWRNVTGATQAFSGVGTSFTGPGTPGNPTYTIVDATAGYGTVAGGAMASCATAADCIRVGLSIPAPRPITHWDATLREDILPAAQGQAQPWALHVGGSFADVAPAGGFYRFVETLLHRGVTAGCGAAQYCPAASSTREQMAVFVLVAKEGLGYSPAACGAVPMFGDVPPSSPFCRWIEELARRGVVGGCSAGSFCPSAAVTRDQMAVFVLRTLDPALVPPACAPPNTYPDVPETSAFCPWIEELTRRAVVSGCGGGNYCPAAPVTRQQMAVFIAVTFALTLYGS